jgi:hypothetical protein
MGAGRNLRWIGFLAFITLLNTHIFSDTGSRVTVTISAEELTVGSPFSITLLVDYPVPENVNVIPPSFSTSLSHWIWEVNILFCGSLFII